MKKRRQNRCGEDRGCWSEVKGALDRRLMEHLGGGSRAQRTNHATAGCDQEGVQRPRASTRLFIGARCILKLLASKFSRWKIVVREPFSVRRCYSFRLGRPGLAHTGAEPPALALSDKASHAVQRCSHHLVAPRSSTLVTTSALTEIRGKTLRQI